MTGLTADEEFLLQTFRENRVAHLCVHNEQSMIHYDTQPGTQDRAVMEEFCRGLAAFRRLLAPYVMTVNTQYDIRMTNDVRRQIAAHRELPFDEYLPEGLYAYDETRMKISVPRKEDAKTGASAENLIRVDIIDPDLNDYLAFSKYPDAFAGFEGNALDMLLHENKRDVIIGTGMYAHACIPATLSHAVLEGYTVYAVQNRILNHPWRERETMNHAETVKAYDRSIRRIDDATVLKLAMMA